MRTSSAALVLLLPLALGCGGGTADDGAYPSEPVKVIVPFGAGGGTDGFARIIEKAVEDNALLPQPLVIVNLGGAGGTIGSRRALNAEPDGHTVMVLHNAILTAKATRLVEYGPEAFDVVAATGFVGQVIAVWDDSPYQTLDDLIDAARAKPGELRWACNLGALTHFSGLQLEQSRKANGAAFNFVPSGGGADRFADLKGGNVDVTGFSLEEFTRYKPDGLRGLCFLGAEPYPGLDLPTANELGYTEAVRDNLFYWWMPKGTPPDRIEAFADVLERVMALPEVRRKLEDGRIDPVFVRGPELHERLAAAEKRNAGIKVPPPPKLPDFPLITLVIVGVLTAIVLVIPLLGTRSPVSTEAPPTPETTPEAETDTAAASRPGLAVAALAITVAYVGLLSLGVLDFRLVTLAFVLGIGTLLVEHTPRRLGGLAAIAVAVSLGVHTVFTRLFEIVLP